MGLIYLAIAIISEVAATAALAGLFGLSRVADWALIVLGYGIAFLFLSLSIRTIPVGVAYAIWSGAGIVLINVVGMVWLREKLDAPALLGIGLIMAGLFIVQGFSQAGRL